jgi:hypothetical protein
MLISEDREDREGREMVFGLFADGEMFRNAIPRLCREGGVFWGHCDFGWLRCWDVDGRSWETWS